MQYSADRLRLIHEVLLRPLKPGEQFKVLDELDLDKNANSDMVEMEGEWVTVVRRSQEVPTKYHDPAFSEIEDYEFYDYSVGYLGDWDFEYHWYEFHMNIFETNKKIMEIDRVELVSPRPNLPQI